VVSRSSSLFNIALGVFRSDDDDDDDDLVSVRKLKHFNFQAIATIKNKPASGNTLNTKDWSYVAYLTTKCAKL
jgi:hypothetical protein